MLKHIKCDRIEDMIMESTIDEDFVLIGKESFSWGERDYYQVVLLDRHSGTFHYYIDNRYGAFEWQSEAYPISAIAFVPTPIEKNKDGIFYLDAEYLAECYSKKQPEVTKYI